MIKRKLGLLGLLSALCLSFSLMPAHALTLPNPVLDENPTGAKATIVLAGGCFWGMQSVFQHVKGVTHVTAGYAGGSADTAHYETVGSGETGHAESVKIDYDPSKITLGTLLKIYFAVAHNPTELNHQGPDDGTQYRSTIFYAAPEQKRIAEAYIAQLNGQHIYSSPVATTLEPLKGFYAAEDYHQDYAELHPHNPYILLNDAPKVSHLKEEFADRYTAHHD